MRPVGLHLPDFILPGSGLKKREAETRKARGPGKKDEVSLFDHAAAKALRQFFRQLSPGRHADVDEGGSREITAGQGKVMPVAHGLQAFAESGKPGFVLAARERESEGKAGGAGSACADVAHVHGRGLEADVEGREVASAKMRVLGKDVGGHGERAAPFQHGAVVAAAEQKRGVFDGKKAADKAEDVVFAGDAHAYSRVR